MPDVIDTQSALDQALPLLRDASALALDTESDAFHAYRPRICLLQISVPGHDLLVDPLAEIDLAPLGELLGDEAREVVLHAAENDVIMLKHEQGWRIRRLFDTQVACLVLGLKPYSLAGILEARFGVKLDKREQRSDWGRRPLRPEQVEYAVEDTRHLLELASELRGKAEAAGRVEEIEWECERIAARDWSPEPFDPEGFRRITGAKTLDPVSLRILRDLFLMRNAEAERRNWAPFRIASDTLLVRLAREKALKEGPGVPKGFLRRYGRRVTGIIKSARDRGPLPEPKRRRNNQGAPVPTEVKLRYERLRRWRSAIAEARGVETFVVARNELLMRVAESGARSSDELRDVLEPFRWREYGDAIVAVLLESDEGRADNARDT